MGNMGNMGSMGNMGNMGNIPTAPPFEARTDLWNVINNKRGQAETDNTNITDITMIYWFDLIKMT